VAVPGRKAREYVPGAGEGQVQPAGVDLRVGDVEVINGPGVLGVEERIVPSGRPMLPSRGWWALGQGAYRVRFMDVVRVPEDAVGPRSSLLRMGASLECAVWDPGYEGRGQSLLVVHNPRGIQLQEGARIAQLVFVRLEEAAGLLYRGRYQGEGLEG